MHLGVLVAGAHPAPELVELARTSRDHGYRRLWHADERFFRDPFSTLGYMAAAVPDLDLGVAVTDPYVRHPALTARAAATLAEIAPGRFTLGLGAGISGLAAMKIQRRSPLTAMRESIELLRALWRGGEVTYDGQIVEFAGSRLAFVTDAPPPIFIASNGPKMLALAGELADGVIVQGLASPTMIQSVRELLREGAAKAGRDPAGIRLVARVDVCVDDDQTAARDRMRAGLVRHLAAHHPRYHSFALAGLEVPEDLQSQVADLGYGFDRPGAMAVAERIPTDWIDRFCLAGSQDAVAEHLQRLANAGVDELLAFPLDLEPTGGGLDTLQRLGRLRG